MDLEVSAECLGALPHDPYPVAARLVDLLPGQDAYAIVFDNQVGSIALDGQCHGCLACLGVACDVRQGFLGDAQQGHLDARVQAGGGAWRHVVDDPDPEALRKPVGILVEGRVQTVIVQDIGTQVGHDAAGDCQDILDQRKRVVQAGPHFFEWFLGQLAA